MLQANKGVVVSKFHQTSMSIRYKELRYFVGVFNRISSISGLLAGFSSSAMLLSVPRDVSPPLVVFFLFFAGGALGCNLVVILLATLCCLWGPGKALRGNDSSHLHEAIEVLEAKQRVAMRYFAAGLFCYFLASIMVTWIFFDFRGAALATALLLFFCCALARQSLTIQRAFAPSAPWTTGHIKGNPMQGRSAPADPLESGAGCF